MYSFPKLTGSRINFRPSLELNRETYRVTTTVNLLPSQFHRLNASSPPKEAARTSKPGELQCDDTFCRESGLFQILSTLYSQTHVRSSSTSCSKRHQRIMFGQYYGLQARERASDLTHSTPRPKRDARWPSPHVRYDAEDPIRYESKTCKDAKNKNKITRTKNTRVL